MSYRLAGREFQTRMAVAKVGMHVMRCKCMNQQQVCHAISVSRSSLLATILLV